MEEAETSISILTLRIPRSDTVKYELVIPSVGLAVAVNPIAASALSSVLNEPPISLSNWLVEENIEKPPNCPVTVPNAAARNAVPLKLPWNVRP